MKSGDFRDGIPAGVAAGKSVANKVGFAGAVFNDAAIVYSADAKSNYILVVMTDGRSWGDIAEIARAVDGGF
jgi:beta-lactamase class A